MTRSPLHARIRHFVFALALVAVTAIGSAPALAAKRKAPQKPRNQTTVSLNRVAIKNGHTTSLALFLPQAAQVTISAQVNKKQKKRVVSRRFKRGNANVVVKGLKPGNYRVTVNARFPKRAQKVRVRAVTRRNAVPAPRPVAGNQVLQRANAQAAALLAAAQQANAQAAALLAAAQQANAVAAANTANAQAALQAAQVAANAATAMHVAAAQEAHNAAQARQNAEAARDVARGERQAAETARQAAETARDAAHVEREAARAEREASELARQAAVTARDAAQTERQASEVAKREAVDAVAAIARERAEIERVAERVAQDARVIGETRAVVDAFRGELVQLATDCRAAMAAATQERVKVQEALAELENAQTEAAADRAERQVAKLHATTDRVAGLFAASADEQRRDEAFAQARAELKKARDSVEQDQARLAEIAAQLNAPDRVQNLVSPSGESRITDSVRRNQSPAAGSSDSNQTVVEGSSSSPAAGSSSDSDQTVVGRSVDSDPLARVLLGQSPSSSGAHYVSGLNAGAVRQADSHKLRHEVMEQLRVKREHQEAERLRVQRELQQADLRRQFDDAVTQITDSGTGQQNLTKAVYVPPAVPNPAAVAQMGELINQLNSSNPNVSPSESTDKPAVSLSANTPQTRATPSPVVLPALSPVTSSDGGNDGASSDGSSEKEHEDGTKGGVRTAPSTPASTSTGQ